MYRDTQVPANIDSRPTSGSFQSRNALFQNTGPDRHFLQRRSDVNITGQQRHFIKRLKPVQPGQETCKLRLRLPDGGSDSQRHLTHNFHRCFCRREFPRHFSLKTIPVFRHAAPDHQLRLFIIGIPAR